MSYPYVFVHGMLGYGESEKMNDRLPYWGMFSGSLVDMIKRNGGEAYAPSVSCLGSAWDRACELYAQLAGGTVDYGEAHSKKYGHERFGRTYDTALIPDWSSEKKIHLLGHSFGGATVRMFSHLMAHGAPEEVAATGKDTSPFFTGEKGDWIQSVTSIAGPHNGTTVIDALGVLLTVLKAVTYYGLGGIWDGTSLNKVYDMSLDQWGVTVDPRQGHSFYAITHPKVIRRAMDTKDNLYWDLCLAGAEELNKTIRTNEYAYHFSISTSNTMVTVNGNHRMKITSSFPLFHITGNLMGKYRFDRTRNVPLDPLWLESDGCSNTLSALHPENEPFTYYSESRNDLKRGIWNVMPVYHGDHLDVIGGSLRGKLTPYFLQNYYKDFFRILEELD